MEKQANIGIKGQDFYGHCPHCTTGCAEEIGNLLSNRYLVGSAAGSASIHRLYDTKYLSFTYKNDPNHFWAELTPGSTANVQCICECGYGFSGGGVTDEFGNPIIYGGRETRNTWKVYGKGDQLEIFPICGDLEIQYSGNNYHGFTRKEYIPAITEPYYPYRIIKPGYYVNTNHEVFFLLVKSVCSDTSTSKRSQHPHMVGVNTDYEYSPWNGYMHSSTRWISRGREFDNNEFPKRLGLQRTTVAHVIGTIDEIESCDTQECKDTCDGFTTGPPWRKQGDPSPWECATITNGVYDPGNMNCRASTVFLARKGTRALDVHGFDISPLLGSFSTYNAAYDAVVAEYNMGVQPGTSQGGTLVSRNSKIPTVLTPVGNRGYTAGITPAACESHLRIFGSNGERYFMSDFIYGVGSNLKSTLGRDVWLGGIRYNGWNGSMTGNVVGANLNSFNVFTNDDSCDLSSTDAYYPASRSFDGRSGNERVYHDEPMVLGLEFYQAHISYRGDGTAINRNWPLVFGQPIFSKAIPWSRNVVSGKNIDVPPVGWNLSLIS